MNYLRVVRLQRKIVPKFKIMKKIIFLYALLVCCFIARGQETQTEKNIVLNLPQGNEKPAKQAILSYLKTRKNTQIINPETPNVLTYRFGDILFQINADSGMIPKDRLEKFKMVRDNFSTQVPGQKYSSELKTLKNYRAVLIKTQTEDFCYYRFMAVNNANNKIVFATMEYNKTEEAKAKSILEHILNHLKFK